MLVYIHIHYVDELTLKDATLNVTEISEIVGFNNVTNFIQVFKKVYGISPKKYRMREDQDEKGS